MRSRFHARWLESEIGSSLALVARPEPGTSLIPPNDQKSLPNPGFLFTVMKVWKDLK